MYVNSRIWCLLASQLVCSVADRGTSTWNIIALLYPGNVAWKPCGLESGSPRMKESQRHIGVFFKPVGATQKSTLFLMDTLGAAIEAAAAAGGLFSFRLYL